MAEIVAAVAVVAAVEVAVADVDKFNESVIKAICGENQVQGLDEFELLEKLNSISKMEIPYSLKSLKEKEVRFKTVCDKENMIDETNKFLA